MNLFSFLTKSCNKPTFVKAVTESSARGGVAEDRCMPSANPMQNIVGDARVNCSLSSSACCCRRSKVREAAGKSTTTGSVTFIIDGVDSSRASGDQAGVLELNAIRHRRPSRSHENANNLKQMGTAVHMTEWREHLILNGPGNTSLFADPQPDATGHLDDNDSVAGSVQGSISNIQGVTPTAARKEKQHEIYSYSLSESNPWQRSIVLTVDPTSAPTGNNLKQMTLANRMGDITSDRFDNSVRHRRDSNFVLQGGGFQQNAQTNDFTLTGVGEWSHAEGSAIVPTDAMWRGPVTLNTSAAASTSANNLKQLGVGVVSEAGLINQKGALMSLGGLNVSTASRVSLTNAVITGHHDANANTSGGVLVSNDFDNRVVPTESATDEKHKGEIDVESFFFLTPDAASSATEDRRVIASNFHATARVSLDVDGDPLLDLSAGEGGTERRSVGYA